MRAQQEMEARRRESLLMDKLMRQSAEETRIAEKLHVALQEKEVCMCVLVFLYVCVCMYIWRASNIPAACMYVCVYI